MADQHDNAHDHDQPMGLSQPPLFDVVARSSYAPKIASVAALTPQSSLPIARYWFRRALEQAQHPKNTVESYIYDLAIFEQVVGPKQIDAVTARDIAHYLGEAQTRSTRKRRLTSVSQLFKWLVQSAKMLEADPTESFYPDHIPLKTPRPLFEAEQQAILDAAANDSSRSALIVWLLLNLGLSRGELLALRRDHIDFSDPDTPIVYVFYENPRWAAKERKLAAGPDLTALYERYIEDYAPEDRLFELLPQSVNKLVERVARAAGISKQISPQTLRDTYAVEQAREGAEEEQLLLLLGLADDSRNRMSVRRYVKLAAPPANASSD